MRLTEADIVAKDPNIATLAIEDESILLRGADGHAEVLNATAALVWACLDGSSPLGEICTDLATGLGVPYQLVLDDTLAILAALAEREFVSADGFPFATPGPPFAAHVDDSSADSQALGAEGGTVVVDLEGRHLRLRTNDERVLELLGALLAPIVLEGDRDLSPDTIQLVIGCRTGSLAPVHFLYHGHHEVLATTQLERLIRFTLAYLEHLLPVAEELLRIRGRLLVRGGEAAILTAPSTAWLDLPERGLARAGWHLADIAEPLVRRGSALVAIPQRRLQIDPAAFEPVREEHGRSASAGAEFDVRTMLAIAYDPPTNPRPSLAQRVVHLLPFVSRANGSTSAHDLEDLATLAIHAEAYWVPGPKVDSIRDLLRRRKAPPTRQRASRADGTG